MANSRFEYVKKFEIPDTLLPGCWMVVRIDGRSFHKFTDEHKFKKPNDDRALGLMNECARNVMKEYSEISLAFGMSDEYSFILKPEVNLYGRRNSKILSSFVSTFTSSYVFLWSSFFPKTKLKYPPVFDGRVVCYPGDKIMKDYLSWRQADCHINNLYNYCFWNLVESGIDKKEAHKQLTSKYKFSKQKNELLFQDFNINYNNLPSMHRKGTVLVRLPKGHMLEVDIDYGIEEKDNRENRSIYQIHEDIIGDKFWKEFSFILESDFEKNKNCNNRKKQKLENVS